MSPDRADFDRHVRRAIDRARDGELGSVTAVDVELGWTYPPFEGGELPRWYRDAGDPFRDAGARGLALIHELLGAIETVDAEWRSLGGDPNLAFDDWHATLRCTRGVGALQLKVSAKPAPSELIIHGSRGELRVDLSAAAPLPKRLWQRVTRRPDPRPLAVAVEPDAHVAHWAEKIARAAEADHAARVAKFPLAARVPFLVTGAGGHLGRAIVDRLVADGHAVRAFVRRLPDQPRDGVEYAFGNLGDPAAVARAVAGAHTVIHAGAATKGGWPEHRVGTVVGTQNVIAACEQHGVQQLVYISSMSVVDWAGSAGRGAVDEGASIEPRPDERGAYTRAKLEAEQLVTAAAARGVPAVILRPGQIFGGGIAVINGAVARSISGFSGGRWLVLGDGTLELPLVYIDDVVDAIIAAIAQQLAHGEIIQIIDPDHLTQADVLALAGHGKHIVRVPRPIVFALGKLSELPLAALGKQSPIAAYRLQSALARLHYDSRRAHELLGWQPRVGVREGIRRAAER